MNRFSQERKPHRILHRLVPSAMLTVASVLFLWNVSSSVTETTIRAQMENLKQAILRSAVSCYAFEGAYPESLSYLKEHYGVTWNENKYVVDYEIIGANLMPSVTVIPLN